MATLTASPAPPAVSPFAIVLHDELTSRMTEEEFWKFCQQNRHLRIERDADQNITIMLPTSYQPGLFSTEALIQVGIWHRQHNVGVICDSNVAFTLPDHSIRAADAAWVSPERDATVVGRDRFRFAHICPDFVIEVSSPSDSLPALHEEMVAWISNGACLGFLVHPPTETAWVYRPGAEPTEVNGFDHSLSGEDVLPGFVLELRRLRR